VNVIYKVGAILTCRMINNPAFALRTREELQHTSGRTARDRAEIPTVGNPRIRFKNVRLEPTRAITLI